MGRFGTAKPVGRMRGFALALVALAILLRIAIPAGWMPSTGGIGITLCTGYGPVRVTMALPGHHDGKADAAAREHPCAFAGFVTALAEPADVFAAVLPPAVAAVFAPALLSVAIGHGLAAPPPPPTGPPASL